MNSGYLNQPIIFQYIPEGTDEEGYPYTEPVTYLKTWASLKTLRGRSRYIAAQTQMENNRDFTIRYNKKLDDNVRPKNLQLLWKGSLHEIESIENDDGQNITMTVICKAVG